PAQRGPCFQTRASVQITLVQPDEPSLDRHLDGGRPLVHSELLENLAEMAWDRSAADTQQVRHFLVSVSLSDQAQYFDLSRGQSGQSSSLVQAGPHCRRQRT